MPTEREAFKLESVGALSVGVKDRWVAPFPGEVIGLEAVVGTASVGAAINLVLDKNGTSILPAPVAIAAGTTVTPALVAPLADGSAKFATGDVIDINVTQVGAAGTTGADLDVTVEFVSR